MPFGYHYINRITWNSVKTKWFSWKLTTPKRPDLRAQSSLWAHRLLRITKGLPSGTWLVRCYGSAGCRWALPQCTRPMGWSPGTTYWHLGWAEQRLFVPPAPGFFRLCSPVRNSLRANGVNRGCNGGTEWNGTKGSMGSKSLYRNSQRKPYIPGTGKRGGPWHATCPSGLPEATPSFYLPP